MQHQVNLRGAKKHHDTTREMMATSSHVFSSISRGGTQMVYGGRLFLVSARTNKRHRHHQPTEALGWRTQGRVAHVRPMDERKREAISEADTLVVEENDSSVFR